MRRRGRFGFGLAMALAGLLAIAGAALAADRTVDISGFAFAPGSVTVTAGDTVTWTNSDEVGHTATGDGDFDTGSIAPGGSAAITFSTAGTYAYVCTIHPTMTGTVVVEAAADGGGGGGGGGTEPTAPPTNTVPDASAASEGMTALIGPALALLGAAMIAMTLVLDRRARAARRIDRRD